MSPLSVTGYYSYGFYFSVRRAEGKEGKRNSMYYLDRVVICLGNGEYEEVGFGSEGVVRDSKKEEVLSKSCEADGVLWITDCAVRGRELLREGKAVLIWLHEGNRQDDFSAFSYACESLENLDRDYLEGIYRRYQGIPWDILETKHLRVRETTIADVDEFYRIYEEPEITRFMDNLYENPEDERAYARDYIDKVYAFYGFGIWTVVEKDCFGSDRQAGTSEKVIGRAGICYREGYEDPELGFMIAVDRQGQGYATEVCRAVLQYAHEELGFERILAFVQMGNNASGRVCEKLGMKRQDKVAICGIQHEIWCHEA